MTEETEKKKRGRPVKNETKPIPAPAEKIAKANSLQLIRR